MIHLALWPRTCKTKSTLSPTWARSTSSMHLQQIHQAVLWPTLTQRTPIWSLASSAPANVKLSSSGRTTLAFAEIAVKTGLLVSVVARVWSRREERQQSSHWRWKIRVATLIWLNSSQWHFRLTSSTPLGRSAKEKRTMNSQPSQSHSLTRFATIVSSTLLHGQVLLAH